MFTYESSYFIFMLIHVHPFVTIYWYWLLQLHQNWVPREYFVTAMYNKYWKNTPYTGILIRVSTAKMKFYWYSQTSPYGTWEAWSMRSHPRYCFLENLRNARSAKKKNRPHVFKIQPRGEFYWHDLFSITLGRCFQIDVRTARTDRFLISVIRKGHCPIEQF